MAKRENHEERQNLFHSLFSRNHHRLNIDGFGWTDCEKAFWLDGGSTVRPTDRPREERLSSNWRSDASDWRMAHGARAGVNFALVFVAVASVVHSR